MNWKDITTENQFQDLLSNQQVFVVFKHSTRCSISSMVKNRLERDLQQDIDVYYLDLIAYRNVSNHIAQVSGVTHESPQIIVFKNGSAVYDASHTAISADELLDALEA